MVGVRNTIQIYGGLKMISEGIVGFIGIIVLYLFGRILLPDERKTIKTEEE